ncbi:hypothetical protein EMCRGX_G015465 [Ephydatia muelleri]
MTAVEHYIFHCKSERCHFIPKSSNESQEIVYWDNVLRSTSGRLLVRKNGRCHRGVDAHLSKVIGDHACILIVTLKTKKTQGTQAILTDAAKLIFVCEIHFLADYTGPGV